MLPIHTPFGPCYACFGLVMVFLQVQNMHKIGPKCVWCCPYVYTLWVLLCMFGTGFVMVCYKSKICIKYVQSVSGAAAHIYTLWILLCMFWTGICNGVLHEQKIHKMGPKCIWASSIFFLTNQGQTREKKRSGQNSFVQPTITAHVHI